MSDDLRDFHLVVGSRRGARAVARGSLRRRRHDRDPFSAVTRQHIDLFQGGQLSAAVVEAAKNRFHRLLERGEVATVEANLRPGMHYVIHVRALAQLGTETAGKILERQLQRRLTDDRWEQSWYWIDLAGSLRDLNRIESLPHLLRCSEAAAELPLAQLLAAEVVCFLGFAGYLRQCEGPLGRAALRTLHRALEGVRDGVLPQQVLHEVRLGEAVEQLWDHRPDSVHPLVVRVFAEAVRQVRRAPYADARFNEDPSDGEGIQWQMSRLEALEPILKDYLAEAATALCQSIGTAPKLTQADILLALEDLRADSASALLPLLGNPDFAHKDLAVRVLTWSRDPRTGPFLRELAGRRVEIARRTQKRRRAVAPARPSAADEVLYQSILRLCAGIRREKPRTSWCWPRGIGTRPAGQQRSAAWVGGTLCSGRCSLACRTRAGIPVRKCDKRRGRRSRASASARPCTVSGSHYPAKTLNGSATRCRWWPAKG